MVDHSQEQPWVQVIGRIGINLAGRESTTLAGSTRTLLAILVAAGPSGISLEDIAVVYWHSERPVSWEVALRVSISHLNAQLESDWHIRTQGGTVRIEPGHGFIDAWRAEAEFGGGSELRERPWWLDSGAPFDGISGIEIVDRAAARLSRIVPNPTPDTGSVVGEQPAIQQLDEYEALVKEVTSTRRTILTGDEEQRAIATHIAVSDAAAQPTVIVGDRGLLLPLGPFAMAFPELRHQIRLKQGVVEAGSAERARRVVADSLAIGAAHRRQRVIIVDAHQLDRASLMLIALMIDRGPVTDFSMLLLADSDYRDIRWLDFVRRAATAGCQLIELGNPGG